MAWMLGGGYVNYFSLAAAPTRSSRRCSSATGSTPTSSWITTSATSDGTAVPLSTVGAHHHRDRAGIAQPLPAAQRRHDLGRGRAGRRPGRCARLSAGTSRRGPCRRATRSITAGSPRQYVQESSGFVVTFAFALIIIFLSLAALFESFRDPLIILVSVPMSIAGALSSSASASAAPRSTSTPRSGWSR